MMNDNLPYIYHLEPTHHLDFLVILKLLIQNGLYSI